MCGGTALTPPGSAQANFVKIKMITGDQIKIARTMGKDIGLGKSEHECRIEEWSGPGLETDDVRNWRQARCSLRCVLVCTHETFTKARSICSRSTENGPVFPQSSRVQPRSQEKCQPSSSARVTPVFVAVFHRRTSRSSRPTSARSTARKSWTSTASRRSDCTQHHAQHHAPHHAQHTAHSTQHTAHTHTSLIFAPLTLDALSSTQHGCSIPFATIAKRCHVEWTGPHRLFSAASH